MVSRRRTGAFAGLRDAGFRVVVFRAAGLRDAGFRVVVFRVVVFRVAGFREAGFFALDFLLTAVFFAAVVRLVALAFLVAAPFLAAAERLADVDFLEDFFAGATLDLLLEGTPPHCLCLWSDAQTPWY